MVLLNYLEQRGVLTEKQKRAAHYYEKTYIAWQKSLDLPGLSKRGNAFFQNSIRYESSTTDHSIESAKIVKYKWARLKSLVQHNTSHAFLQKTAEGDDTAAFKLLKRNALQALQYDLNIIYLLYKSKKLMHSDE